VLDDPVDRLIDRDRDRIFIGTRRLEHGEPSGEKAWRHEMSMAGGQPLRYQLAQSVEKDEPNTNPLADDAAPTGPFQSRTGDDAASVAGLPKYQLPA
jgi:hypothetical protein